MAVFQLIVNYFSVHNLEGKPAIMYLRNECIIVSLKNHRVETESKKSRHQLDMASRAFIDWINELTDEQFWAHPDGKWSVAEVMQHLYLSTRPVARLLAGPREVLDQWGRADRPPRPYHEIESAYRTVLATGAKAPAVMSPRAEDMQVSRGELVERFSGIYQSLVEAAKGWSVDELDEYLIPHPVLGMLTVREMLYFTEVHTEHHLRLLKKE